MSKSKPIKKASVVYVLTSVGRDLYSAMTRLSIASVRITNPGIHIAVACDPETDRAIEAVGDLIKSEVDEWLVFETPSGEAMFRNRYIKTNLRNLVDGDFLFLDSDTLVRGDLSPIFALDADIAAAPNHSGDNHEKQVFPPDDGLLKQLGWDVGRGIYYNGGVLFYKNMPRSRHFAQEWHSRWIESVHLTGQYRDQAPMNMALKATEVQVGVLDHQYNAQISANPWSAIDAVIWHYYASTHVSFMPLLTALLDDLSVGKLLSVAQLKRLIEGPNPWGKDYWLSYFGKQFVSQCAAELTAEIRMSGKGYSLLDRARRLDNELPLLVKLSAIELAIIRRDIYVPRKLFLGLLVDLLKHSV
jgi:hypothetical protein